MVAVMPGITGNSQAMPKAGTLPTVNERVPQSKTLPNWKCRECFIEKT